MEDNYIPNDIQTEKSVLGLAILDNNLINILLEKITSNDFYDQRNEIIFNAIRELNLEGTKVDINTVYNRIEQKDKQKQFGEKDYLFNLIGPSYYVGHFESYIKIIKEKSLLRQLLSFGGKIVTEVRTSTKDPEELISDFSERLLKLSDFEASEGLIKISETLKETFDHIIQMSENEGSLTGITTGYRDLDRTLSGLQNSDFVLLAARPSVGKTALGINMAVNAAKSGKKVAVFSLEMSRRQILQRILSVLSRVDLQNIISGQLSKEDWSLLYQKTTILADMDMYIDDTASIPLTELRAKAKRMRQEHGLDLIVIDYLQLMTAGDLGRNDNRQQEISNISRGLKALAKELNIPVLALSQLSRKSEERSNKRPMLSDLRESGAIEQDADVVMMLYRDDYYDQEAEEQNILEVIVGKHRNGPTGTVKLFFQKKITGFFDLEYENNEE